MGITKIENLRIEGPNGKPLVMDVFHKNTQGELILFCHGYKENKHWGAWDLMGEYFAERGYIFVKFNYSFNGTSPENLEEFSDLEAFAQNRISFELKDTLKMIDFLFLQADFRDLYLDHPKHLVGHSRGGAMSILAEASCSHSFDSVSAWAAPANFGYFMPNGWKKWYWKFKKRVYLNHPRTGLKLPHDFGFYQDFYEHQEELNLPKALQNSSARHLLIQGDNDAVVSLAQAEELHASSQGSELLILPGMNHNLGNVTPWKGEQLPEYLQKCVDKTLNFMRNEN